MRSLFTAGVLMFDGSYLVIDFVRKVLLMCRKPASVHYTMPLVLPIIMMIDMRQPSGIAVQRYTFGKNQNQGFRIRVLCAARLSNAKRPRDGRTRSSHWLHMHRPRFPKVSSVPRGCSGGPFVVFYVDILAQVQSNTMHIFMLAQL